MTTLADYAARLAAHLTLSDGLAVSALNTADLQELTDAANAGLQEFYLKAPPQLKRTPVTTTLPAQAVISIGVTAGSNAYTGFSPNNLQLYCTVIINGEANVLTSNSSLLYPFTGGATGTYANTIIYGDAAAFANEAVLDRLLDDPVIAGNHVLRLARNTTADPLFLEPWNANNIPVGKPRHYQLEEYGQTQQGRPYLVIRVRPVPDMAYRLCVTASLGAFTITPAQMTSTSVYVPAQDSFISRFIVPIALRHLTRHRLWKLPDKIPGILEAYKEALADIAFIPRRVAASPGFCLTPAGY